MGDSRQRGAGEAGAVVVAVAPATRARLGPCRVMKTVGLVYFSAIRDRLQKSTPPTNGRRRCRHRRGPARGCGRGRPVECCSGRPRGLPRNCCTAALSGPAALLPLSAPAMVLAPWWRGDDTDEYEQNHRENRDRRRDEKANLRLSTGRHRRSHPSCGRKLTTGSNSTRGNPRRTAPPARSRAAFPHH
jgi:hypothetical protein